MIYKMQTENKEKVAKIRCLECRDVFSISYIEEKGITACPTCNTKALPVDVDHDVQITINWHELRILSIWAKNWEDRFVNPDLKTRGQPPSRVVDSITNALKKYRPAKAASLTLMEEIQEIANEYGSVEMVQLEDDEVVELQTIEPEKKTLH